MKYNISFKVIGGESKSVTKQMVAPWNETTLPTLLSKYDLKDILTLTSLVCSINACQTKHIILKVKHALEERIAK